MGRPLIKSIDSEITYPLVKKILPFFINFHPIIITVFNIYFKYVSIYYIQINIPLKLLFTLVIERGLDCLDGEVARETNTVTTLGHYLDKYSDVVFRLNMCYYCLKISLLNIQPSIYWLILISITVFCPSCYLIDYSLNKINNNMICDKNSYAIYIEDNATLICFLLPFVLYCI